MIFEELDKEKLKLFIDGLDENLLKEFFKNCKLHVNGYRDNSAPLNKIYQELYFILEHNKLSIKRLKSIYEKYVVKVDYIKDILTKNNFPEEYAEAIAINSTFKTNPNENIKNIYFLLNEFTDSKIENVDKYIKLDEIVNTKIDLKLASYQDEKNTEKLKNDILDNSKKINEVKKICDSIALNVKENSKAIDQKSKKIISTEELNEIIEKKISFAKNNIEKSFKSELTDYRQKKENSNNDLLKNKIDHYTNEVNNVLKEYEKKISSLEQKIEIMTQNKPKFESFNIDNIINNEYESIDAEDDLYDSTGDICTCYPPQIASSLKNFLFECIFSNRPIVVFKNNSMNVTKILSSLINGGNYIVISPNGIKANNLELIEIINDIQENNDNSVILIKDYLGVDNLDEIKKYTICNANHKLIFEGKYEKELIFRPFDFILNYIPIFKPIKTTELYNMKIILNNGIEQKEELIIKLLQNYGDVDNFTVFNVDIEGYLSFSIIPYLNLYFNENIPNIISKIQNQKKREACEEIINGIK